MAFKKTKKPLKNQKPKNQSLANPGHRTELTSNKGTLNFDNWDI